jgi:hypothetical protein
MEDRLEDKIELGTKVAKVDSSKRSLREIPKDGIAIEERVAEGGNPPVHVKANPDQYYYDSETGKYPRRPEPEPDFSKGEQRTIPCFAKGTLVATITGPVPIESLAIGTTVPAFACGTTLDKPLTALLRNKCTRLVKISVGSETLCSTTRHRFWVENKKQWIAAQYLEPGMVLRTVIGEMSPILRIVVQEVPEQETYNLTVADCHTYFVGKEGFLVHNADEVPTGKIYIGRDRDGKLIYVGQTKQDLLTRQANHRRDGRKSPKKYGFKTGMILELVPDLDGLSDDEMHYHERRIFDKHRSEGHELRYLQEPMSHAKINALIEKYCP